MKAAVGLSLTTLLLIGAQSGASAEPRACKFAEQGFGYIRVVENGESWAYSVSVSGPNWEHAPMGWHAPGALGCKSCSAHGLYNYGLYHFGYFPPLLSTLEPSNTGAEHKRPETAEHRAQRRTEVFGYPYWSLGPSNLYHRASREHVAVGPLVGYAVSYHIKKPPAKWTQPGKVENLDLLLLSLTDGCVGFEPTIITPRAEDENQWAVLDSLLKELSIVRRPSPEAPGSPVRQHDRWRKLKPLETK